MRLQTLSLKNFRNYRSLELEFEPAGHLFLGGNAQGKTNLIEAIHYLATARSQRGAGDEELLRQGAEFFMVQGTSRRQSISKEASNGSVENYCQG